MHAALPAGAERAAHRPLARAGAAAAGAYLLLVAALEIARADGIGPSVADIASSPAGVAAGRLWELLSSGLLVAGDPVVQLVAMAPVVALVVALLGPGTFWRAAFAGHVVATLLAYAGVGVLWVVARADVDSVVDAPDYGVSCVWAAALGALLAGTLRRPWVRWLGVAATAAFAVLVPFSRDLAGIEHLLAFALGAAVTLWPRRRLAAA